MALWDICLCVKCWYLGLAVFTVLLHHTNSCLHFGQCPDLCQCGTYAVGPHDHTDFTVDCSHGKLTSLPTMLPQCLDPDVSVSYHLNFSHNNLSALNLSAADLPQYSYFGSTVDLDLSFNRLASLSDLYQADLSNVRALYLHGNHFTSLPMSDLGNLTHKLPKLEELTFHQNPWVCDCALKPLQNWLKTICNRTTCQGNKGFIINIQEIVCQRSNTHIVVVDADFECHQHKKRRKRHIPKYVTAIISLVLLYLCVCMCVAICIVIRNRHKVKVEDDMQLK